MGSKTVSKTCGTCAGGGSHYDYSAGKSSTCYSCGGTGTVTETVWIDDPPISSPSSPSTGGVNQVDEEFATDKYKTEKQLAILIAMAVFIGLLYYFHNYTKLEWYWNLGIAYISALVTKYLLTGPLRPLTTLLKWCIGLGLVLLIASLFLA